jgi:glycosyltransferase involved in cell wall biosynthesis
MPVKKAPISVLIATKNEIKNIGSCLEAIVSWVDEIVIIDSGSADGTIGVAENHGCKVYQFDYTGGWPKKRQWALDNINFANNWILILDADEIISEVARGQISDAISRGRSDGYWIKFRTAFLGRDMKYGNSAFYKLALFKKGLARYEQRLTEQNLNMADMEIHEHILLNGTCEWLAGPIWDRNRNSLDRFLAKHNEYSNWESRAFLDGHFNDIPLRFWGTQAQRRRWLKAKFMMAPGSSIAYFLYGYIARGGFLDGKKGLIYARIQANEFFNVQAKIYERQMNVLSS